MGLAQNRFAVLVRQCGAFPRRIHRHFFMLNLVRPAHKTVSGLVPKTEISKQPHLQKKI
jgi:hypothetical protein